MSAGSSRSPGGTNAYLPRRGRLTRAQSRALAELSGRYCLEPARAGTIDLESAFGRSAPVGLEIGFGTGQALIHWALERPTWNLLGVEVYQPGIGAALRELQRAGIENVRLMGAPAEVVLANHLAPASVDEIRIFFPDPWPKKRHHKRRLVQTGLTHVLADRLKPGGLVWLATDWEDYARWMARVLDAEVVLEREETPDGRSGGWSRPGPSECAGAWTRPLTRFESRGLRLGHRVVDLRYRRKR